MTGFDKGILICEIAITGCTSPVISGVQNYLQKQIFWLAFVAGLQKQKVFSHLANSLQLMHKPV